MRQKHSLFFLTVLAATPALAQTITQVASDDTWGVLYNLVMDAKGNIYTADSERHSVYKIDPFGNATTIAGTGKPGGSGDGGLAVNAQLNAPFGVALGPDGSLYIGDTTNDRIRKIAPNGIITTYAGSTEGFGGDGGQAINAKLNGPASLAMDAGGTLYFVDEHNARIRKIDPNGVINTVAGNGMCKNARLENASAVLSGACPGYLTLAQDGSVLFTDDYTDPFDGFPSVRRVSPAGIITTIAGDTSSPQYDGDNGPASLAHFESPSGIAVDGAGNIFISDAVDARIRKIAPNGIITTYAGTGRTGATGNDGPALQARINFPTGLMTDAQGSLYYYDRGSPRAIRRISPSTVPIIRSTSPVIPSFLGNTGFASNMYVEIFGTGFTSLPARLWAGSDFIGNQAPTKLDGTSVTVNGKAAFIYYLSPGQININTPDDTATGPVAVQVKTSTGTSNFVAVNRTRLSPALQTTPQFNINGKQYVVAFTPDFSSFIGRANMIAGAAFKAAKPGDSVIIYALGCGPTSPPTQAGTVAGQNSLLTLAYQVRIGGVPAVVTFGGLLGGTVGLYQFNVVIPNVAPGDQPIDLTIDGVPNAQNLTIVVG